MKKIFAFLFLALSFMTASAQTPSSIALWHNGQYQKQDLSQVDSITFLYKSPDEYEYVDLGLSVKWAKCNVGANNEGDYGTYFAWGETSPQTKYTWSTYQFCQDKSDADYQINKTMNKYCTNATYGYNGLVDNKTVLDAEDDAAAVNMGGSWRMPTKEEMQELIDNTTSQLADVNGHKGVRLTSKKNGQSIFLPAAGEISTINGNTKNFNVNIYGNYWTSSLKGYGYDYNAASLYFNGTGNFSFVQAANDARCWGLTIRPVRK